MYLIIFNGYTRKTFFFVSRLDLTFQKKVVNYHCATIRKTAGSIPDCVIGIFY